MCIVVDICDTLTPLNRLKDYQNVVCVLLSTYVTHTTTDIFFTFPPAGPQTKGLVKSLDFPTQLGGPACGPRRARAGPLPRPRG